MGPPALSSAHALVAMRPGGCRFGAIRTEVPRGPVLVLGGAASALAFCRAAQELGGRGGVQSAWDLTPERLRRMLAEQAFSEVVVADREIESHAELVDVLLDCKAHGVRVRDGTTSFEQLFHKVRLEALTPGNLLYAATPALTAAHRRLKRALDIALGTALLVATAPLMALVAAAVRLESRGPAIFSQERVGLRGKPFRILKFRSMRVDAEKDTGPRWASAEDARVTRVGTLLRRLHLDELPQLINVLRGEMSLVGPRPERPCFVDVLSERIPYFRLRHHVKPGITGWAQVEYEYGDSVEDAWEKLQYDLYYTRHASLGLDLLILLKTLKAVLAANGR